MRSILIVEDEENIRLLVRLLLEQQGYTVVEVDNGSDALAILNASSDFDLIITNIQMPVMSGIRLIPELRRLFPTVRLLVVTGYLEKGAVQALRKDCTFLAKPFSRQQFLAAISKTLAA